MSDVVRWEHPRDAAAEAVLWALVEDIAKARKEAAREFVADHLMRESSRGVDAFADGVLIGSVTRSAPSVKRDVIDWAAFLEWVIARRPDLLTVEYRTKEGFLRTLRDVDGILVSDGDVVPGVGVRPTFGVVKVNKTGAAKDVVTGMFSSGQVTLDGGIKAIEGGGE